jgi:hypothetical protein
MNTKEFESLITAGNVERVTINRSSPDTGGWEIQVHGDNLLPELKCIIELNGNGGRRSWADLDAAYVFIRKSGFRSAVEITETEC